MNLQKPIEEIQDLELVETKKQQVLEKLNKLFKTNIIQITRQELRSTKYGVLSIAYAVIDKEWNKTAQKYMSYYNKMDDFVSPNEEYFLVIETPKQLPNGKFLLTLRTDDNIKDEYIPVIYAGCSTWDSNKYREWINLGKSLIKELNETNNC